MMGNRFTVYAADGVTVRKKFKLNRKGRRTSFSVDHGSEAVFVNDNGFKDACRCAVMHGGGVVAAEKPLDSGQDRWEVEASGSHFPVDKDGRRIDPKAQKEMAARFAG